MLEGVIRHYPYPVDELKWTAHEVVRELHAKPHLLTRIDLSGTYFSQRALEPFVRVSGVQSRFVDITDDGRTAHAYFDQPPPERGDIEFGYGEEVLLRYPRFRRSDLRMLDRALLPKGTVMREK